MVISQALSIPAVGEVNNPELKKSHMESSVLGAGQVGAGNMHSAGDPEARLCVMCCWGLQGKSGNRDGQTQPCPQGITGKARQVSLIQSHHQSEP